MQFERVTPERLVAERIEAEDLPPLVDQRLVVVRDGPIEASVFRLAAGGGNNVRRAAEGEDEGQSEGTENEGGEE